MKQVSAIVLAAGKGTRMKSDKPKVLLDLCGHSILWWTLNLLKKIDFGNIKVVVLYKKALLKKEIKKFGIKVDIIDQKESLGTAHAVKVALQNISRDKKHILVLFGDDSGLYRQNTIKNFLKDHIKKGKKMSILAMETDVARPIGGLLRNKYGNVVGIATQEQLIESGKRKIEIVCGAFCFNHKWLEKKLPLIPKTKSSGEYPLPGLIKLAADENNYPNVYHLRDSTEWNSLNTPREYRETIFKKKSTLVK